MLTCFDFFNQVIKKFRDEELEHHDIGLEHDAELVRTCPYCWLMVLGHLTWKAEGQEGFCSQENRFQSDRQREKTKNQCTAVTESE